MFAGDYTSSFGQIFLAQDLIIYATYYLQQINDNANPGSGYSVSVDSFFGKENKEKNDRDTNTDRTDHKPIYDRSNNHLKTE